MEKKKTLRIKDVLPLKPFMKVAIDGEVQTDKDGNYLINIGYIRVSTESQVDYGFGLDVQWDNVVEYCHKHGVQSLVIFSDDGITGTTMDREALDEIVTMIELFNSKKSKLRVNFLVVPRVDRLSRTLLGTLQFIQDYIAAADEAKNTTVNRNKEAINFVSVAEEACTIKRKDPQSQLMLVMFAAFAEFERSQIVQKTREGKRKRIQSGKWPGGGNVPYGYNYDKKSGRLVIVPEEADKVREIFRLYIEEKMSPQNISTLLGFKGERIVTQILKRESLTGHFVYNMKNSEGDPMVIETDDVVDAIIPRERWLEAQEELCKRSVYRGDSHYLLSGLVYCGVCGARCRYQKWDKKTGECKLVCYSHQKSKPYLVKDENCDNKLFWAGDIENAVTKMLFNFASEINAENKKETAYIDPTASIRAELSKAKKHLSKLYDFEDEDEPDEILNDKISKARLKINELNALLQDAEKQAEIERKVEKAQQIFKNLEAAWEFMSQEEKQAVCRELIKSVIIHKDGTVHLDLKIQSYIVKNDPESIE